MKRLLLLLSIPVYFASAQHGANLLIATLDPAPVIAASEAIATPWFVEAADVDFGDGTPAEFKLKQNYPNPFNATTVIVYEVPEETEVTLEVYNALGSKVRTLYEGTRKAGVYKETFDATDVAAGVYFCEMRAGAFSAAKKMILLK
ncbi:MAG: T9SS type A sorting domain-containing protein [Ignavibacteriales bacterium]|nr:T9SS type A sorting domain-containing protein [Ignavibacteriales bacterium]